MKKIFYSILLSGTFLFTACSEDKGTSTEVIDNDHAEVNPNHINDYDQPGTAGSKSSTAYSDEANQPNAQLANLGAIEIVKLYYIRNPNELNNLKSGAVSMDSTTQTGTSPANTKAGQQGNQAESEVATDVNSQ